MKSRHKGFFLIHAALFAVFLLGACGAEKEKIPSASRPGAMTTGSSAAGLNTCVKCHTAIAAEWSGSRHANLESSPSYTTGVACTPCHDALGDSQQFSPARMVVGCESCHGPGLNHANAGGAGAVGRLASVSSSTTIGAVTASPQFQTCTSCHELLNSTGTGTATAKTPTWHGATMKITDTHFATAGQWASASSANTSTITGYSLNYESGTICTDCHNPHGNADVNKAWALSAHADRTPGGAWGHYNWTGSNYASCQRCHTSTGFAKFAEALERKDATAAESIRKGTVPPLSNQTQFKPEMLLCTGCHKDNRGALRNPGAYNANYKYVSGADTYSVAMNQYPDISESNVCMPCHTGRQSGDTLRKLVLSSGPTITTFGKISFINPHYLPSGAVLFGAAGYEFERSYADPGSFQHAIIGTADSSGMPRIPGTGTSGPCIGCHMYRAGTTANHLFRAAATDANSVVTGIASEVCYNCHAGSGVSLAAVAQAEKNGFHSALKALINLLDKKGISFREVHPYMYTQRYSGGKVSVVPLSTTVTGTGTLWSSGTVTPLAGDQFRMEVDGELYKVASVDSDTLITLTSPYTGPLKSDGAYVIVGSSAVTNWLAGGSEANGRDTMGAALNLQLLEHEPGAYIHNRTYTKRLIYDSLDWLDNKKMDYSVGASLSALPPETVYKNEAMSYLLPYGVFWSGGTYPSGTGVEQERP